ncbi:MAG: thioredoxin family protein [Deltaproteobacteria bacterium]|nr:thioredoxin family protein [Deltaproteobacteria bacterium]
MSPDFESGSALTQLFAAFNAGILTSLTPCIYPLIPITLAIFGCCKEVSRRQRFFLALCYVLGIAATYTLLGVISAKTGGIFGSFLSNPWAIAVLSILLILLALFSLDIVKLSALSKLQNSASRIGGKGFRGAFLMGTVSGFVAAPCAGPVLVVILGVAAAQQSSAWGALLLFTYALGMGLLFILLALFPLLLDRLPRSGNWLHAVKFLTAALLFAVVLFITQPFHVPYVLETLSDYHWALFVVAILSFFAAMWAYRLHHGALKCVAAILFACSAFYLTLPAPQHSWAARIEEGLSAAEQRSTLVMVDMYADWCAACKELDAKTFSDPEVKERLAKFALVRVDFTLDSDYTTKLTEQYDVAGLPCLLFLTANGKEIPDSRITGFLEPQEFLKHLDAIEKRAS